jgi:uncharacterized protein (DUF1697 family)
VAAAVRYVALLRAINVGGRTVRMDRLRSTFAELGMDRVETFIASGNVIFVTRSRAHTAALETRIERHLTGALGFDVATFLRTPAELAAVAAHAAFPADATADGARVHIAFLRTVPDEAASRRVLAHRSAIDDFHVHGREVWWLRRGRMRDSPFSGAVLEKALGMPATLRSAATVSKLASRCAAGA